MADERIDELHPAIKRELDELLQAAGADQLPEVDQLTAQAYFDIADRYVTQLVQNGMPASILLHAWIATALRAGTPAAAVIQLSRDIVADCEQQIASHNRGGSQ